MKVDVGGSGLVGGSGAGDAVPLPLNREEQDALAKSAARIREAIESLG